MSEKRVSFDDYLARLEAAESDIARLTAERGELREVVDAARDFDMILRRYEAGGVHQVIEYRRYLVALEHLRVALARLDAWERTRKEESQP